MYKGELHPIEQLHKPTYSFFQKLTPKAWTIFSVLPVEHRAHLAGSMAMKLFAIFCQDFQMFFQKCLRQKLAIIMFLPYNLKKNSKNVLGKSFLCVKNFGRKTPSTHMCVGWTGQNTPVTHIPADCRLGVKVTQEVTLFANRAHFLGNSVLCKTGASCVYWSW